MTPQPSSATVSFPFATALGLVFIVLKLTHNISWSWLWVLAPFWIPSAFVLLIIAMFLAGTVVSAAIKAPRR